ncbi:hypothetical protein KC356_g347 [Hortaea werneckii]|nr:hypothetical protein KC356_g347 [Hortaea werneckii]
MASVWLAAAILRRRQCRLDQLLHLKLEDVGLELVYVALKDGNEDFEEARLDGVCLGWSREPNGCTNGLEVIIAEAGV